LYRLKILIVRFNNEGVTNSSQGQLNSIQITNSNHD